LAVIDQERINQIKRRGNIPAHVAIIMDGNGRWAKGRGLARTEGHRAGIESVRAAIETAGALDLRALTLYTFSAENWRRPKNEITTLMNLLVRTIKRETEELERKNVRLMVIGDLNALPPTPRYGVRATIKRLAKNTGLVVNLALSYSGRQELVHALREIAVEIQTGNVSPQQIDEELISRHLQTAPIGDPDLLIRTSGEMRLSNFLLWQLAYAELYITPILWPDFRHEHFLDAIETYQSRERRFGKVSEQFTQ